MAIFHLDFRHITRSRGLSAVEHLSKITGESCFESRTARTFRNSKHKEILFSHTLFSSNAVFQKACVFWDALEDYEDSYASSFYKKPETIEKHQNTASIALFIRVALPLELTYESQKNLVFDFAKQRFVVRNLVVTYAIHNAPNNPHAFFLISRRSLDKDGNILRKKDREICKKSELMITREFWATLTNLYLKKEGFECRVTHKSFADLGIDRAPSPRLGWRHHKQKRLAKEDNLSTLQKAI